MVTGSMPFRAETVSKLKRYILNGEFVIPSHVSDECQLLIRGILKLIAKERFTTKEILESAWLDGQPSDKSLVPFQLNPLANGTTTTKNAEPVEETFTKQVLEKMGISNDILIYSNMRSEMTPTATITKTTTTTTVNGVEEVSDEPNPLYLNTYMRNIIPASTMKMLANTWSSASIAHSMHLITPDIKQSINGTYRIVFHKIQKKLRNELNSEEQMAATAAAAATTSNGFAKDTLSETSSLKAVTSQNGYNSNPSTKHSSTDYGTMESLMMHKTSDTMTTSPAVGNGREHATNNNHSQSNNKSIFVRLNGQIDTGMLVNGHMNPRQISASMTKYTRPAGSAVQQTKSKRELGGESGEGASSKPSHQTNSHHRKMSINEHSSAPVKQHNRPSPASVSAAAPRQSKFCNIL